MNVDEIKDDVNKLGRRINYNFNSNTDIYDYKER